MSHAEPTPEVERCTTPGCRGDARYAAPGRGHVAGCTYPAEPTPEVERLHEFTPRGGAFPTHAPWCWCNTAPQPTEVERLRAAAEIDAELLTSALAEIDRLQAPMAAVEALCDQDPRRTGFVLKSAIRTALAARPSKGDGDE
jgi:hypothetical protein